MFTRGMQLLVLSLALIAALFSGCETSREVQHVDKPTARMVSLRFQDVKLGYASLLFYVEIDNPYPADLPLVRLRYSLTSGGNTFLTATALDSVAVQPNRKEVVSLPDEVIYARLLKSLNSKPGSTIPYKAILRLFVDAPNLGLIELSSEKEGWLVLPNAPEINVEAKIHRALDVLFIPTPQDVVDKMLELAEVKKGDLVYDLGCGDGRILIAAAKSYGCRAVGYDLDPDRVKESIENVEKSEVGHLITIEQKDIFTLDLSEADVITLYLLPSLNVRLIPQLEKLKPGSRIVSHNFDMEGVKPDKVVKLTSSKDQAEHKIYLWTTPLKREQEILTPFLNNSFGVCRPGREPCQCQYDWPWSW
jgi:SAM-dependent methyltransferase/LEA14-like dessication related protein